MGALHPNFGDDVRRVPIWVASLRGAACELAGECADGFIGHSIWSQWWLEERALPALHKGASQVGRDLADIEVQLWLTASIDSDPAAAARRARGNVAFYASIPSYRSYFEAHGFGELFDTLVEARRSLPLENCLDLVPLEAARTFAVCGTADEVGEQIHSVAQHATLYLRETTNMGYRTLRSPTPATLIEQLLFG